MPGSLPRPRRRVRPSRSCLAAASLAAVAILAAGCAGAPRGSAASGPSAASTAGATLAQALKYTDCMRSKGIADFPDPNSQGQINISVNGPDSDLAPGNPKFQAAEAACKSLQPTGGTPAQEQQDYAAELRYVSCMRSRGVAVPEPKAPGSGPGSQSQSNSGSGGAGQGTYGNGVNNPNSPQFIAANKACQKYLPAGQGPSSTNLNGPGGGS